MDPVDPSEYVEGRGNRDAVPLAGSVPASEVALGGSHQTSVLDTSISYVMGGMVYLISALGGSHQTLLWVRAHGLGGWVA